MRVKDTVFASPSERELFTALASTWSTHFNLWPSLPFLNIIDVDGIEVTSGEWNSLLRTSMDITLCTRAGDRPVMSIEFDGMGHGFSREGQYVPWHPSADPHRKLRFDLKLRIAEQVKYPLVVLSYEEKNPIGPALALTVTDGIVGQVLANRHMHALIQERLGRQPLEGLPPGARDESAQHLAPTAERQADLYWNPIARLASQYEYVVGSHLGVPQVRHKILQQPELADLDHGDSFLASPESREARLRAMKEVRRIGCQVDVDTPKGHFSDTVWVRNMTGYGPHPMGLAEDFAKVVVLKQVAEAYGLTEGDVLRLSHAPPTEHPKQQSHGTTGRPPSA